MVNKVFCVSIWLKLNYCQLLMGKIGTRLTGGEKNERELDAWGKARRYTTILRVEVN